MEKLSLFFAKIRELSFWQRLFSWRSVRNLSYDAFEEFKSFQKEINKTNDDGDLLEKKYDHITTQNEGLQNSIQQYEKNLDKKDDEITLLNYKMDGLNNTVSKLI